MYEVTYFKLFFAGKVLLTTGAGLVALWLIYSLRGWRNHRKGGTLFGLGAAMLIILAIAAMVVIATL
jgi:NO-binding membrane sensor protein with MHYT domain